jgi:hypothetical protein
VLNDRSLYRVNQTIPPPLKQRHESDDCLGEHATWMRRHCLSSYFWCWCCSEEAGTGDAAGDVDVTNRHRWCPHAVREVIMPYLAGLFTGIILTVLLVFVADNLTVTNAPSGTQPQTIVNWGVASQKLHSSVLALREGTRELRDEVHEATR